MLIIHLLYYLAAYSVMAEKSYLEVSFAVELKVDILCIGVLFLLLVCKGIEVCEQFHEIALLPAVYGIDLIISELISSVHHPPMFFQLSVIMKYKVLEFEFNYFHYQ